jgi:hypothetical protein
VKNVAEHLVDLMLAAGIRHVYGMVGDSANPVIDAIRRAADELTFVPGRNEEAGAFAAGAEALITGRPTAVLGSSGPSLPCRGTAGSRCFSESCSPSEASVFLSRSCCSTTRRSAWSESRWR